MEPLWAAPKLRAANTPSFSVQKCPYPAICGCVMFQHVEGLIIAAVIDGDQLPIRKILPDYTFDRQCETITYDANKGR